MEKNKRVKLKVVNIIWDPGMHSKRAVGRPWITILFEQPITK